MQMDAEAEEFGSAILSVILQYLDVSQYEFSSASSASLKYLLRAKIYFFFV